MYGFRIIVEGDYACFTRPEMKVERVSYDVPTPGALEGMLKSVYSTTWEIIGKSLWSISARNRPTIRKAQLFCNASANRE